MVILCGLASSANAAGIQLFNQGPALSGAIWYPCSAEPKHVELGDLGVGVDYGLVGVKDCPVTGTKLPLVVFSHGTNGWFGGHHDTAAALADAGFLVAAINHPGDTAKNSVLTDDLSVFGSRPADIVRLIDFVLQDWKDKAVVDPARIGLFGFSKGGVTGLMVMGAAPDFARVLRGCKDDPVRFCEQLRNGETANSAARCARQGRGDRGSAKRGLHQGQSRRHQDSSAVLAGGSWNWHHRSRGHGARRPRPSRQTRYS